MLHTVHWMRHTKWRTPYIECGTLLELKRRTRFSFSLLMALLFCLHLRNSSSPVDSVVKLQNSPRKLLWRAAAWSVDSCKSMFWDLPSDVHLNLLTAHCTLNTTNSALKIFLSFWYVITWHLNWHLCSLHKRVVRKFEENAKLCLFSAIKSLL